MVCVGKCLLTRSTFLERDSFLRQLLDRGRRLAKIREAHASEHRIVLGELDIGVLNDLHPVSPRISELNPASRDDLNGAARAGA